MKRTLFVTVILLVSLVKGSFAYESPSPFSIRAIYVSSATNYHFRVYSDYTSWHCDGGPTGDAWSYVNEGDSGAKEKIQMLKLAYVLGKKVSVKTEGYVSPTSGIKYCHIVEVIVN